MDNSGSGLTGDVDITAVFCHGGGYTTNSLVFLGLGKEHLDLLNSKWGKVGRG